LDEGRAGAHGLPSKAAVNYTEIVVIQDIIFVFDGNQVYEPFHDIALQPSNGIYRGSTSRLHTHQQMQVRTM
jgi:hypothetical protein